MPHQIFTTKSLQGATAAPKQPCSIHHTSMFLHYNTRPRRACCLSLSFNKCGEKLKDKRQNEPKTSFFGFKARGKGRMKRRESVLCPREPARQGRRSVGMEWAGRVQEEALWRRGGQSARTTASRSLAIDCYRKKQVQAMQRSEHLRAQTQKSTCKQCCAASKIYSSYPIIDFPGLEDKVWKELTSFF